MAEKQWTPAQKQAIDARGGTVLVSAAAGSGKTAVLVERILRRMTDPVNPVPANRLLIVTFTKAAAAEMHQRLAKGLDKLLQADPTNPLLRRQMLMLPTAHISTTHAFCASLLRDQFHLLGLSPDFKVLEDKQAQLLSEEALAEFMDEAYAGGNTDFLQLSDRLGSNRDDRDIADAIRRIHTFAGSFPFPDAWLQQQLEQAADMQIDGSVYDELTRRRLHRMLDCAEYYTGRGLALMDPATPIGKAYIPAFESDALMWQALREDVNSLPRAELKNKLDACAFDRMQSVSSEDPLKLFVQNLRKHAKAALTSMQELLVNDNDELFIGQQLSEPLIRTLVEAVRGFTRKFREKKAAMNGLDFNDLEHLTVSLLYDEPGVLSAAAKELSANYDEIFVDEYQDTNEVQDAIFRALSQNGENLFYVGDVKQSIYGFRQACPRLFMQQRKCGHAYDGVHFPATVTLGNNFRSRMEVTEAVNYTFSLLMREDFGGIEYNRDEELVCSAKYPEAEPGMFDTEITLINIEGKRSEVADIAEARTIAADIERMMRTMPVTEDGEQRPARYGDFCILLRSKKSHAENYVRELQKRGIPAYASGSGGFLTAPEVGVLLSLLRYLDNPTLDIPLAAVMMSPLYRFTVDEMSQIRLIDRYIPLVAAVQKTAKLETPLGVRCRAFLEQTGRWRTVSPVLTVDRLLERIFDESGITDIYGVQKKGPQRVANLQQLYAMARSFEENGYRGLSAFVRMCDRMEENEQEIDPAKVSGGVLDGVPVLSVHHSKGLEYPVVFMAGCAVTFSTEDTKGDLLLHREAGLGVRVHDHDTLLLYESPARLAARMRIKDENTEELLRVLYVAMTRAREKLCIVSADVDMAERVANGVVTTPAGEKLPVWKLASARSFQDWLLSVAALHPSGYRLRELAGLDGDAVRDTTAPLAVRWVDFTLEDAQSEVLPALPPFDNADAQQVAAWQERMAWKYPYYELKDIPNKLAASAIAHSEQPDKYIASSKPAFMQEGGLSAAGRGTAMHQFMQFADYASAAVSVTEERDRLVSQGWLTQLQADNLDIERLQRFFQSELYSRMSNAEQLWREPPFVTLFPAGELFPERGLTGEAAAECVAIRGVADCVFVEDGGIVIVDYKTDRVKTAVELHKRYSTQLHIYARAMQEALALPVKQCVLWSFALGCEVEIPLT